MRLYLLSICILLAGIIQAQTFTEIPTNITPMFFASADFADFDNDGDQDLAIIGVDDNFNDVADIFRNDEGTFTPINAGIAPMHMGAVSWADYDGDGDYDLFCSGQDYSMNAYATLYSNEDGIFVPAGLGLPTGFWNSAGWGDYDNDGDLDLAYSWYSAGVAYSSIFRNDAGTFVDINAGFSGLTAGSMEWGDYDGDGDPDLLFTGTPADFSNTLVLVYENQDGTFTDIGAGLIDCAWYNNAVWADTDNDGDLDILYVGDDGSEYPFVVYTNTGDAFEMVNTGLYGVRTSNGNISVQVGDLDNDGYLDVVNTGDDQAYAKKTKIFINEGGAWSDLEHSIPGFGSGTLDLTDVDNDGDLDIFFVGYDNASSGDVAIFINDANSNTYSVNEAPGAPSGLASEVNESSVQLLWDAATDDHTPQVSLQYNIYIGTETGHGDMVCAQSITDPLSANNGFHMVPKSGNCQNELTFWMESLEDGVYYWSVQAIDQSGAASMFADEQYFDVGNVTSINETETAIEIYPNPVSDLLHISGSDEKHMEVSIFNIAGQQVISEFNGKTFDVSELKPGSYILQIKTAESIFVEKLQIR